ncbi:unnamed protein product [Cylicocyclus nassatus]|uniref:G-protein coupled receptors family 1 profile domain-containing protein n=1 Tax=Cylicocyclus nassatus TaxID=53992 RepID=A0AA36HDS4_CYLNA|nr:unnamed protein product [Cylicocyclus nassatus]
MLRRSSRHMKLRRLKINHVRRYLSGESPKLFEFREDFVFKKARRRRVPGFDVGRSVCLRLRLATCHKKIIKCQKRPSTVLYTFLATTVSSHVQSRNRDHCFISIKRKKTGSAASLVNVIVMVMIIKTSMFHNSFGYICFCHLIADFGAVFPNVFWTGPVTLFNPDESITKGYFAARVGQLSHFFWYESIYCHLLLAINRMMAVTWPLSYRIIFTRRNLMVIISITWLLSMLHTSMYWLYDCSTWYDDKIAVWMYRQTLCTQITSRMTYIFGLSMSGLIVLINTLTLFGLQKQARILKHLYNANAERDDSHSARTKLQIKFYVQGCVSAAILVIALIGFNFLPTPTRTSQVQFVLINSVIWETVQTSNA